MEEAYRYELLGQPKRKIRLMTIHPAESNEAPLECSLQVHFLADDELPTYATVSYVWGDPALTAQIRLDGATLRVNSNVENVLRRLRRKQKERVIWMDFVCINQNNRGEKGKQVELMSVIYRQATQNLIYLGGGDGQAAFTLEVIRRLNQCDSPIQALPTDSRDTAVLDKLFSNDWFHRLWVLQEAILPRGNECIYGVQHFALHEITQLAFRTMDKGHWMDTKSLLRHHLSPKAIAGIESAQSIFACRKSYNWIHHGGNRGPMDLAQLLSLNSRRAAIVQHDRVYAVLGLLHSQIEGKALPEILNADYDKSLRDVYRDATRQAILDRQDPFVLGYLYHPSDNDLQLDGYPSWVPRWDLMAADNDRPSVPGWWHKAHKPDMPNWRPRKVARFNETEPDVLEWYGLQLSEVAQTSPVFTKQILQHGPRLLEMIELVEQLAATAQPTMDEHALATTLICGEFHLRDSTNQDVQGLQPLMNRLRNGKHLHNLGPQQQKYHSLMLSQSRQRRLFITADGRIGMGPSATRAGDVAAIFNRYGCPMILRPFPESGYHQLVGPGYVHGVMKGEAMREHIDKGEEDVLFKVR